MLKPLNQSQNNNSKMKSAELKDSDQSNLMFMILLSFIRQKYHS